MYILITFLCIYVVYQCYLSFYFKSDNFNKLKNSIMKNTLECNELNKHVIDLHDIKLSDRKAEFGHANLKDNSNYNFKRKEWSKISNSDFIHECSLSVCKNAKVQPLKYLCKYFNIKTNEDTLDQVEEMLNRFLAFEEGKKLLLDERERIYSTVVEKIPFLIALFSKNKVLLNLGFDTLIFDKLKYPVYTFQYVSSGGNSSAKCEIILDINNLENFILYLKDIIKFKKSIEVQRALMTQKLREKIKIRDNYTCKFCGNSIYKEPNLLLEIDHIIPISKGGITAENNLQTLCWKCNRSKSNKII